MISIISKLRDIRLVRYGLASVGALAVDVGIFLAMQALFVVSALIGLALTTAIVGLGEYSGIDPRLAKLGAIAASFILTYIIRSKVVFQRGLD